MKTNLYTVYTKHTSKYFELSISLISRKLDASASDRLQGTRPEKRDRPALSKNSRLCPKFEPKCDRSSGSKLELRKGQTNIRGENDWRSHQQPRRGRTCPRVRKSHRRGRSPVRLSSTVAKVLRKSGQKDEKRNQHQDGQSRKNKLPRLSGFEVIQT